MINEKTIKAAKLRVIYISSNNVRCPVTKNFTTPLPFTQLYFTPLHYNFRHLTTSHLHFTTVSFGLTPFKFPTAPLHLTSLHFSQHFAPLPICAKIFNSQCGVVVKALRYKPSGRGFDSRWCHWNFSVT